MSIHTINDIKQFILFLSETYSANNLYFFLKSILNINNFLYYMGIYIQINKISHAFQ